VYRVRRTSEVFQTSSPSMDISKASNFERYVYDLVGRDARQLASLWQQVDQSGVFDLRGTPAFDAMPSSGFASGSSSHADRLKTIRAVFETYGQMIDTHTADGLKVGLEHREAGVPLICLETALPAKFAETIREALGRDPVRPSGFEALEQAPQRFTLVDADVDQVKRFIASHART
jgi:threonine synthase